MYASIAGPVEDLYSEDIAVSLGFSAVALKLGIRYSFIVFLYFKIKHLQTKIRIYSSVQ